MLAVCLLESLLYCSYHGNESDKTGQVDFKSLPLKNQLVDSHEFDDLKTETLQNMIDRSDNISTYLETQQDAYFYALALPYILDME